MNEIIINFLNQIFVPRKKILENKTGFVDFNGDQYSYTSVNEINLLFLCG